MKISKELLSEVLDIRIEDIVDFKIFMNELFYYQELLLRTNCQGKISKHRDSIQQSINIYEFAYKCKEWAYKNSKVNMITVELCKENEDYYEVSVLWGECFDDYVMHYFKDKNEIVAIIKACNWILEKKD